MSWRNYGVRRVLVRFSSSSPSFKPKVIETVPAALHTHLFGTKTPLTAIPQELQLQLPVLKGQDIVEHFRVIASEQSVPYLQFLEEAAQKFAFDYNNSKKTAEKKSWIENVLRCSDALVKYYPLSQIKWKFQTGWTRYSHEDGSSRQVSYPEEDVIFFDIEVCMQDGQLPTLAVALTDKAWYGWCSERLANNSDVPEYPKLKHLIPLGDPNQPRIIIGHNVGYDRARVRECYSQQDQQIRFMDTMSMSLSMFGMADHQAPTYQLEEELQAPNPPRREKRGWLDVWKSRVTKNSLKDIANFLFGIQYSKTDREYFIKDDIGVIREKFQELMTYCAQDNLVTAMIYSRMWPEFRKRFPEDITVLGMLTMGNSYLPINKNWRLFYDKNNEISDNAKQESAWKLLEACQDLIVKAKADQNFMKNDIWLFHQVNEAPEEMFYKLFKKKSTAKSILRDGIMYTSPDDVQIKSSKIPYIFGMIYNCYPLYRTSSEGWGYLAPRKPSKKANATLDESLGIDDNVLKKEIQELKDNYGDAQLPDIVTIRYNDCDFYKIPHPSGNDDNVGSVIAKNFYKQIDSQIIRPTRYQEQFENLLKCTKMTQHWTNYRERFEEEIAVYFDDENNLGAIAPAIRPAGTISRRSVHKLWIEEASIGKGIKNMVQAPKNMKIVGADVDSQEQWLAAIFGDSSIAKLFPKEERYTGITPFSNMMLAGSKSDGSDLHSVVARELKIGRNEAKTLNYARLYGSGQMHAEKALMKNLTPEDAKEVAANLFALTKGVQIGFFKLSSWAIPLFREYEKLNGEQSKVIHQGNIYLPDYSTDYCKTTVNFEDWVLGKLRETAENVTDEIVPILYDDITKSKELYFNGYETATFNFLEQESRKEILRTPVLDCQLTDALALLPEGTPDREEYTKKYKRSVMNWIVQSSAVDFLHLLLVSMNWLCKEYNIDARFVISIHDEVRYLCPTEEAPRVGLALMLSHLYVRTFISHRIGFRQLPMSVAFFSQVDCDTVLRKEVTTPCRNPDGEIIQDGTAWNINDLIKLTGGSLHAATGQKTGLKQVAL